MSVFFYVKLELPKYGKENPAKVPFPTAQQVNLPACSHYCLFNAERQAGKLWIPVLKSLVRPDSISNPSLRLPRGGRTPHSAVWTVKS